jgi:hypothetical protein
MNAFLLFLTDGLSNQHHLLIISSSSGGCEGNAKHKKIETKSDQYAG